MYFDMPNPKLPASTGQTTFDQIVLLGHSTFVSYKEKGRKHFKPDPDRTDSEVVKFTGVKEFEALLVATGQEEVEEQEDEGDEEEEDTQDKQFEPDDLDDPNNPWITVSRGKQAPRGGTKRKRVSSVRYTDTETNKTRTSPSRATRSQPKLGRK